MEDSDQKLVPLGRISGVFGLQGWVKVFSDTDPMEGIVDYPRMDSDQGWPATDC